MKFRLVCGVFIRISMFVYNFVEVIDFGGVNCFDECVVIIEIYLFCYLRSGFIYGFYEFWLIFVFDFRWYVVWEVCFYFKFL